MKIIWIKNGTSNFFKREIFRYCHDNYDKCDVDEIRFFDNPLNTNIQKIENITHMHCVDKKITMDELKRIFHKAYSMDSLLLQGTKINPELSTNRLFENIIQNPSNFLKGLWLEDNQCIYLRRDFETSEDFCRMLLSKDERHNQRKESLNFLLRQL